MLAPGEIAAEMVEIGKRKARLGLVSMFLLAVMAGVFIGFGGLGSIIAGSMGGDLGRILGACIFPVGLILVVLAGAELFTGNNLMMLGVMNKKIRWKGIAKNLVVVWLGNLVGAMLLALAVYFSGVLGEAGSMRAGVVAASKASLPWVEMIFRGILCNVLVVLAVWMAAGTKSAIGKIAAIWFPIMLFVFCGMEHSVANMFFLPLGAMCGAGVDAGAILLNLGLVTVGNLIGGGLFVPMIYYFSYLKNKS